FRPARRCGRTRSWAAGCGDPAAPLGVPTQPNQRWSMDFVSDSLYDGRKMRSLNIVDDYSRECLATEVDTSLPGARVVRMLEQLREQRGLPEVLVTDNG